MYNLFASINDSRQRLATFTSLLTFSLKHVLGVKKLQDKRNNVIVYFPVFNWSFESSSKED